MLEIKNLSCGYNGIDVVHDISFSVKENEKLCIIGPNGCGKSTLLKAISNVISHKGEILINNLNSKKLSRSELSKEIALLGQISTTNFDFSVYDTVEMGRYIHSKKKLFSIENYNDKEIVEHYLKQQDLFKIKDKSVCELSGGQLQRVLLARAFVQQPNIILLDEPTNHLDIKCQIDLLSNLDEWIRNSNRSVVAVLHDINISVMFADKIILMDNGKIVFYGEPEELIKSDLLKKVYQTDIVDFLNKSLKKWS